jgi:hypothetical protein
MKLDWFTVNHYYAGTENIPPSFQTFDVVKREDAEALEKRVSDLEIALGFIEEQAILLGLPGIQRQVRSVLFGERK